MSAERQWPDFEWSPEAIEAARNSLPDSHLSRPEMRYALNAAVKAQPIVALPPCPKCKGEGRVNDTSIDMVPGSCYRPTCPACDGSGVERMVPEAALRAWIEEQEPYRVGSWRYSAALDDLSVFLDSLHAEPGTDRSER